MSDYIVLNSEPHAPIPIIKLVLGLMQTLPAHKCGLYLEHNQHKDYYQSAEQWIKEHHTFYWLNEDAKREAIDMDSIWTLQWYPETPMSFHAIAAPTLLSLLMYFEFPCS